MTAPEEALARARAEAARRRAADGSDREPPVAPPASASRLYEWALIEPDLEQLRSARRHGAAITALKRLLARLLLQQTSDLAAQQTRFNVNLLARVRQLEARIEQLERDRRPDL